MVRFFFVFWALFFAAESALCADYDFRRVKWGMTRVEVAASEELKPAYVNGEYISYKIDLFNREVFLLYEFIENSLLSSRYVFDMPGEDLKFKLVDLLTKKYGNFEKNDAVYIWKKPEVEVTLEPGENLLRVIYKSTAVLEKKKLIEQKLSENEKKYLFTIF